MHFIVSKLYLSQLDLKEERRARERDTSTLNGISLTIESQVLECVKQYEIISMYAWRPF